MKEFQKIKKTGSSMLSEAESSARQEFGSFYLSRFLGFKITHSDETCILKSLNSFFL